MCRIKKNLLFSLICIRIGTCKMRRLKRALLELSRQLWGALLPFNCQISRAPIDVLLSQSLTERRVKAWPNARNISTHHVATLLGSTCCIRLATLLRYVATCWMMLDQIWKRSNFSCNILDIAWCCTRLATFTQHCCPRACALGPLLAHQGPGAHGHWHVALKMMKMLRACVWPPRATHVATSCNNVARCCVEMLGAFGQPFMLGNMKKI